MTTLEKLQMVPNRFWINVIMIIAIGILAIIVARHAAELNRVTLSLIVILVVTTVGFQWVYERNEPAVLTPFVSQLAKYLPSKPGYHP